MQDFIGQQIDCFRIIDRLGMGGMAVVYKAYDIRLERNVALKFIRTEEIPASQYHRLMMRFDQEAKAQARFSHPHIVSAFDYGEYEGIPYLVLAYMPNGTLKERIGGGFQISEALETLIPIADAVAYAHRMGVLHRDIKPSNIIFSQDNAPMLTDFGIAKVLETTEGTLTGTGFGVGTPEYMAPEQWQGKAVEASDQYALGVVLYELLTGQKPFTADTPLAVAYKQISEPLPRPSELNPEIPEDVEKVLYKVLAREPHDRFENMKVFQQVLEELLKAPKDRAAVVADPPQIIPVSERRMDIPEPDSEGETFDELDGESLGLLNVNGTSVSQQKRAITGSSRRALPSWILWSIVVVLGTGLLIGGIILFWRIDTTMGQSEQEPQLSVPSIKPTKNIQPTTSEFPSQLPELTKDEEGISIATPANDNASEDRSSTVNLIDEVLLVYVPAGEFFMSVDRIENEATDRLVYLDAYWIDKLQVTNQAYRRCVEANVCNKPRIMTDYDNPNYRDHPVVFVNWFDANDYCTWAGGRLPTEEEWEKAARGTDGRLYPWGNDPPNCNLANYAGCEGGTMPVGTYLDGASPYGVMDMAGNVWEWIYFRVVEDENDKWLNEDPTNEMPEMGRPLPPKPMVRGGSWSNQDLLLRISSREQFNPEYSSINLGFRCVLTEIP